MSQALATREQSEQRSKRGPRRAAVILCTAAGSVLVPAAAFAQTTAPTLPDAGDTAKTIVNTGGSQLASTAIPVLPYVIGVLVLFWAINFALSKVGMKGKAKVK